MLSVNFVILIERLARSIIQLGMATQNVILVTKYTLLKQQYQQIMQMGRMVYWKDIENSEIASQINGIFCSCIDDVNDALLDRLPNVKIVSNFSVGYDTIDVKAVLKRGIQLGYTPAANADAVADFALTLLLSSARQIIPGIQYCRSHQILKEEWTAMSNGVSYKTVGIIGMGAIGYRIAKRCLGFDMKVLYNSRRRKDIQTETNLKATYCELDDLLSQSDFVIIAAALTNETVNLISKPQLQLMKKTAILVNISRGKLVDQDALVDALENKRIAGAALDVSDPEPLPLDHKLLSLDNAIMTPHMAWATTDAIDNQFNMALENLKFGLKDQKIPYPLEVEL